MMLSPERIARITSFDELLEFLRDELKWPLELDASLEELSFAYDRDELQISPVTEARLAAGRILQLQQMTEGQPWGLFFVQFESAQVYVSALRDILRRLVKQEAGRTAYAQEDLLFICATGNFEQFTLAHFQNRGAGQQPLLETFDWNQGDTHVRTLCEYNFEQLKWQEAFEENADKWRDAWRSAFDVGKVTDKFFGEYESHFRKVEESVTGFEARRGVGEGEKKELEAKRNAWTQKFFNRLLFIAFVQKKGWLLPPETAPEGNNYLERLWSDYETRKDELEAESFYTTRLKPLFAALNSRNAALSQFIGKVPYLNGGLFDTEEDGLNDPPGLKVPDSVVRDIIFQLFARYNFTVQESTPLDVQVAVDPEMLGKVFERLILERDRAFKGSFYTPRVVVTFMCRESLKRFLGDEYAPLIERHDVSNISVEEAIGLLKKLETLRVVDPACGSGAYLLGMLHELFVLNQKLDTRAYRATARDDYRRKLDIIQKNLYGVDKDAFAVQIARLRLWLSLAVEFDTSGGEAPEPLPNLDFKIEIGDSLTAPAPSSSQLALYREQIIECARKKFEYSDYHNGGRREKAEEIAALRQEISHWLRADAAQDEAQNGDEPFDWLVRFGEVFLPQNGFESTLDGRMAVLDKASKQPALSAPTETIAGGFDIVLANPPYGSEIAEKVRWKFFNKTTDGPQSKEPYGLFLARGIQLLRPGGCLCYIVSNTWRTLKSHKPLRKRLVKQTRVEHLLDLPRWIFEATVDTGILTLVNAVPDENHQLIVGDLSPLRKNDWSTLEANLEAVAAHGPDAQTLDYARYTYPQHVIESYDNLSFFIGSPRLYMLMSDARFEKLSEIADVKVGLQTGDNAFYLRKREGVRGSYKILDEAKLLSDTEIANLSEAEKRDGVDPKKYSGRHFVPYDKGGESDAEGGWLPNYYVPIGYFIDWSQKAVKRLRIATIADTKRRKGEINKIKASDETTLAAVIRSPQFYFRSGVTFSRTGAYAPTFRLSAGGLFDTEGSMIYSEGKTPNVLLAASVSHVTRYITKNFIDHTVHVQVDDLKEIPVPKSGSRQQAQLETLVAQIITKQKQNPRYTYHDQEQVEIDKLVYKLYGLSADDIREVELWYCRRYPKLAAAQGMTKQVTVDYSDFLERAKVQRSKPYRYWSRHPWLREIGKGEGAHATGNIEFKRQFDQAEGKTWNAVAGFLNGAGGVLFLGVTDAGDPVGLAHDFSLVKTPTDDKFKLKLADSLQTHLELHPLKNVKIEVEEVSGQWLARVQVLPLRGSSPVFVDKKDLYVRGDNRTDKLEGKSLAHFLQEWPNNSPEKSPAFLARRGEPKIQTVRPATPPTSSTKKAIPSKANLGETTSKTKSTLPTKIEAGAKKKTPRPINDYSRDELIKVLRTAMGRAWILREDAIVAAGRTLGFARTGSNIRDAFKSAINGAIRRKLIEAEGDWIRRAK